MLKKVKCIVMPIMFLFCMMFITASVSAADDRLGTVVDGSLLTDETEATGIGYPKERGSFLSYGTGSVSIVGSRKVKLTGATAAYQVVGRIQVKVFLQRLVGSNWVHVLTMGPTIKYNTNYVSYSNSYSVSGGYYYRAYGHHVVIHDGKTEAVPSYSNGIWVA